MNLYGEALAAPIQQTILPAMDQTGRVYGFYPITSTLFTGNETDFTLPDTVVPLKSVTLNSTPGRSVDQYMAAVWPTGLAHNDHPWKGSASFIDGADGYYRWFSMPTLSWFTHFGMGTLLNALNQGMSNPFTPQETAAAPNATSATMKWEASLEYSALYGECAFFDFNWLTVFQAKSSLSPVRIVVISNPTPIAPATVPTLKATVIGIPSATVAGPVYDTIRIIKLGDTVPGEYVFNFRVYDDQGQSTPVTFTLNVL
jgi:hypothetical protein